MFLEVANRFLKEVYVECIVIHILQPETKQSIQRKEILNLVGNKRFNRKLE